MAKQETRYFLFNRGTAERTGQYKAVKNVQTREQARDARRSSVQNLGIYDRHQDMVIS